MRRVLHLLPLFLLVTSVMNGQPPRPEGRGHERVERLKKVRMIEVLGLSEDQSVRFFARLSEHEKSVRESMKLRSDLLDRIERTVRGGGSEKDLEKLFDEVRDTDSRIHDEKQRFFSGLSDLLSVEQRGKLLLFERQFERELREAMRELRQRRMKQ